MARPSSKYWAEVSGVVELERKTLFLFLRSAMTSEQHSAVVSRLSAYPRYFGIPTESTTFPNNSMASLQVSQALPSSLPTSNSNNELDNYSLRLGENDPSLTRIDLSKKKIGVKGVVALVAALGSNTFLLWLDLSYNEIGGHQGAAALASALRIWNSPLQTLDCSGNDLHDTGATTLARPLESNAALRALDLGYNEIGAQGAKALAVALESNRTLQVLSLGCNNIGDEGAMALAKALQRNSTLQELYLDSNKIEPQGAKAFATALASNTTLKRLDLGSNTINEEGGKALASAFESNESLQCIDLGQNEIGAQGAAALARALERNSALQELNLGSNGIGDNGTIALENFLQSNTTLHTLGLRCNSIGHKGAMALAKALESNTALQTLDLHHNKIGAEGAMALAKALESNATLQNLNLSDNYIKDEGATALANALLPSNSAVEELNLLNNAIGNEGAKSLAEALKSNSILEKLNLGWNHAIRDEGIKELLLSLRKDNGTLSTLNLDGSGISAALSEQIDSVLRRNASKCGQKRIVSDFPRDAKKQKICHAHSFSPSDTERIYIQESEIAERDVLCGSASAGSNHPGNREYLAFVDANKDLHRSFGSNEEKNKLKTEVVNELARRGFRFVREQDGRFYLLTLDEVRYKVGQRLKGRKSRAKKASTGSGTANGKVHEQRLSLQESTATRPLDFLASVALYCESQEKNGGPTKSIGSDIGLRPDNGIGSTTRKTAMAGSFAASPASTNTGPPASTAAVVTQESVNEEATSPPSQEAPPHNPGELSVSTSRFSPSETERITITKKDITDDDILCGRGFKGSTHPGNKKHLKIVIENAGRYDSFRGKHGEKTKLRNSIVDEASGRFVMPCGNGKYYLLTVDEARTKVSQALRDNIPIVPKPTADLGLHENSLTGTIPSDLGLLLTSTSGVPPSIDDSMAPPTASKSDPTDSLDTGARPSSRSESLIVPKSNPTNRLGAAKLVAPPRPSFLLGPPSPVTKRKHSDDRKPSPVLNPAVISFDSKPKPAVPPSGTNLSVASISQSNNEAKAAPNFSALPSVVARMPQSNHNDHSNSAKPPSRAALPSSSSGSRPPTAKTLTTPCFSPSKTDLIYISQDEITNEDILCGRELAGSDHPGNVAYLRMVAENKALHHSFGSQHGEKTKLRNMIVHELVDRGGRFVRMMHDGRHHLLTVQEARAKVSQSLRENKHRKNKNRNKNKTEEMPA